MISIISTPGNAKKARACRQIHSAPSPSATTVHTGQSHDGPFSDGRSVLSVNARSSPN